jgi:hypothetical protein
MQSELAQTQAGPASYHFPALAESRALHAAKRENASSKETMEAVQQHQNVGKKW